MKTSSIWIQAWSLLSLGEKRQAIVVLIIIVLGSLSSALVVGSVLPFLSIVADPAKIHGNATLSAVYDHAGFTSDYMFLVAVAVATVGVILVTSLVQVVKIYVVAHFTMMRAHSISHRLLATYMAQPYVFFTGVHSGDLAKTILAESGQVVRQFFRPAAELIASALSIAALLALLLWVNATITLAAGGIIGGTFLLVFLSTRKRLRHLGELRIQANGERYRIGSEALRGIKDIRILGREAHYVETFKDPSERMMRSQVSLAVLSSVPSFVVQALIFGGIIVLCLALIDPASFASGAEMKELLPLLGVMALAAQRLMPELSRFYTALSTLQYGGAAVSAVAAAMELEKNAVSWSESAEGGTASLQRELELRNVVYRYPGASRDSLSDICLRIRAGEKIGIVGTTGAGKSTLADIALGLLTPSSGQLLVDGIEVSAVNLRGWQRAVGYVPQDTFLVDATIAENIALGMAPEQIDRTAVVQAAVAAQITELIDSLPAGYDTHVGERGVRFSGGQRQRIAIARALYHDAALIVFDEATSALDSATERDVMTAIEGLSGAKTVLLIAHRLSTVKGCDKVLVLREGRVSGFGPWSEVSVDNADLRALALLDDVSALGKSVEA